MICHWCIWIRFPVTLDVSEIFPANVESAKTVFFRPHTVCLCVCAGMSDGEVFASDAELLEAARMAEEGMPAADALPEVDTPVSDNEEEAGVGAWVLQRSPRRNLLECKRKYEKDLQEAQKRQRVEFERLADIQDPEEYYAASKAVYAAEMRYAGFKDAVKEGIRPCGQEGLRWGTVAPFNPDSDE